jgi:hypothetical protein
MSLTEPCTFCSSLRSLNVCNVAQQRAEMSHTRQAKRWRLRVEPAMQDHGDAKGRLSDVATLMKKQVETMVSSFINRRLSAALSWFLPSRESALRVSLRK